MLIAMLKEAFSGILANRMRSFLTMLGMIIGVGAVVLMLAVGEGAHFAIKEDMDSLGRNLFIILSGSSNNGGVRSGSGNLYTLTLGDLKEIQELPGVLGGSPSSSSYIQLIFENQNWNSNVRGVYPYYLVATGWTIVKGRSLDDIDEQSSARVALIGQTVAQELFKGRHPLDQTIRVNNTQFKIIGVLGAKGQNLDGYDQDDTIIIPFSSYSRFVSPSQLHNSIRMLFVQAESEDIMSDLMIVIRNTLRERHRLSNPEHQDDFYIQNLSSIIKSADAIAHAMTVLLGAVAAISLSVGGIGIMNIMLVSVTERTREIGIRLAIGARRKDILTQFVLEAVIISVVGGVVGLIIGICGTFVVEFVWSFKPLITIFSLFIAFTVSVSVGLFFGFYPAWKASLQNPIETLHYQ